MTYKSELSAQFAKEAMACQSLDNDEILNVRWATEDPNPVSKVNERARLEELGQQAIKEKMDHRVVDAMRSIRALEDGDVLDDDGHLIEDGDEDGGGREDSDDDDQPAAKRRRIDASDPIPPPPKAQGLLSADTMEGLKYFAEIRKRNGALPSRPKAAPPPVVGGLNLGDYGSDEE